MSLFDRRVSFDCFEPDLIPPIHSDLSSNTQIIPNTPFKPCHRSSAPSSPVIRNDNKDSNTTLQSQKPNQNRPQRRVYHELSDMELLELDAQFAKGRTPDIDSFRSLNDPRLSNAAVACGDTTPLSTFKTSKLNQRVLKEYPTKSIISRSSITLVFNHPKYHIKENTTPKTYLLLLSMSATSSCALNYYKQSLMKSGDVLVVAFSLSSRVIGDKTQVEFQSFLKEFTDYILDSLPPEDPIKVIFEIFKTPSFLNDLMTLYVPSSVIIGTDRKYSRSTSFAHGQRKFISLVYAGLEEFNRSPTKASDNITFKEPFLKQQRSKSLDVTDSKPSMVDDPLSKSNDGAATQIQIKEPRTSVSFDNKTTDLFSNLNQAPDPKPRDLSLDRRGSMHSTSTSFSSGGRRVSGSAIESDEDDDAEYPPGSGGRQATSPISVSFSSNVLVPPVNSNGLRKLSSIGSGEPAAKWKSINSGSSVGTISKEERDRLALFEKHQKAIANVNTKKDANNIPRSMQQKSKEGSSNSSTSTSAYSGSNSTTSSSSTGKFFKKLLGRK